MIEIEQLNVLHRLYAGTIDAIDEDDLFRVPPGFSNHVAWNAAHAVAVQQSLCYRLSGVEPRLDPALVAAYSKGTGPAEASPDTYRAVMEFAPKAPGLLAEDYAAGHFADFQPYTTSNGVELATIEEAIAFNHFHAGVHLGVILGLRKALAVA